jgi:DNA-binding beta-propeller fold protein YncE
VAGAESLRAARGDTADQAVGLNPQGSNVLVAGGESNRRSTGCPVIATTSVAPACPIRLVSFRLSSTGSAQPRILFLDAEGQICP